MGIVLCGFPLKYGFIMVQVVLYFDILFVYIAGTMTSVLIKEVSFFQGCGFNSTIYYIFEMECSY